MALPLTLTACASLSPQSPLLPNIAVPATWSSAVAAGSISADNRNAVLARWWQRFDDPLLDGLITQALRANTSVNSAQAALAQARALRDVAAAGLLPRVAGSASAGRSKSGDISASNAFNAGFDASWEPDVFGGKRSALQAGEASAQASAASLADVQVSIAAETAVSYIQYRGAQTRLMIARSNLASQLETLQITDWRVQAGLLTSLEGEQARAASEQTRAQIPTLETSVAQIQHSLAVLCGQTPDTLRLQLAAVLPVPQAQDDLALSMPTETLRQRPDVRAAEHQVSAALARVGQADAARYPSFNLSGSLGLRALTLGTLTGSGALASALLGSVSGPLFDAGAGQAQVRAQQAALEQARLSYQATVLTALKDVEDALVALGGDRERLLHLRDATDAAANAALIARQRYASGLIDFQTVLETQRSLFSTQDAVAITSTDLSADHVRLYKALGGGWQPERDSAMPPGQPGSANITQPSNS
ncbi:MAG: efflux transporter outer membrane subunit [Glaciimonas sp.]|nr:efflux transporter outer membrane subunit [Glaciimonas sp.]